MLSKAKHKSRLTQNESKNTQVMQKQKHRKIEESDRTTWSPFPSTPWKNLSFE